MVEPAFNHEAGITIKQDIKTRLRLVGKSLFCVYIVQSSVGNFQCRAVVFCMLRVLENRPQMPSSDDASRHTLLTPRSCVPSMSASLQQASH